MRFDVIEIEGFSDLVQIGQGGLGDVYRARRESTGSTVAIKVLRDVSDESVAWHRTRRELTALVALAGHGNVIQLLELLDLPEGPALVMEYAPGGSVADLLRDRDGTLHPGEVVLIGRQTAGALAAAHGLGIVHRDVKPQNLLIDAYGQVKLCDFGVAALTRSEEFRTRTNALSMRYASPEDLDDDAEIGPPSDVYSLGATLLHLVHGAPPSLKERLAPWVAPPVTDPTIAAIDQLLTQCLHPDPAQRPTADDLHERLERIEWDLDGRRRALDVEGVEMPDLSEVTGRRTGPPVVEVPEPAVVAPSPAPFAGPPARPVSADEVTTARRPDRPLPRPSAAPPEPDKRRWWIPAVVLLIAVAAAVVVFWPDDEAAAPAPATAPATTVPATAPPTTSAPTTVPPVEFAIVERPAGLRPITDAAIVWPFGDVGECLLQVAGDDELQPISCDEPHDLQRFAVAEFDGFDGAATFEAAAIESIATTECRAAFEVYVGAAFDDSEPLDAPFTVPSAATWGDGDRRYQCFIGVPDARLVGDARDSAR